MTVRCVKAAIFTLCGAVMSKTVLSTAKVLFTNTKSHTPFLSVQVPVTLNDLEEL